MDETLAKAINESIRTHQTIYGASIADVVLVLTMLQAYYVNQVIKDIKTDKEF